MTEIGDALRERRMALKIDVHEVEESTKIRAKYLRALENEEYNLLPGQAYVKSFLRTYADFLGLDSRGLVDLYKKNSEGREEDHLPFGVRIDARGASGGPSARRWIILAAIVLVVVLALFLIGTLGGGGSGGG